MMRLRLHRMDHIGEFHRILDEENRDIVADQVPVALVRVELHGEAADIARRIGGAALACDRGKAHEYRRTLAGLGEDGGARQLCEALITLEVSVCARPTRVNDAFGNPFMIKMRDL